MARASTAPTTKIICTILRKTVDLAPPILAQPRIPFACPSLPMRLSRVRDDSTTKPNGPRTARSHLFGALAMAKATLLTLITSSAGKGDPLQKAMDSTYMFDACGNGKPLKSQTVAQMNACSVKNFVGEQTGGCKFRSILSQYPELTNHQGLTPLPGKQTMHRREQSFQG
jgi:hypothetical protein